jgi:hypothetical protein
MTGSRLGMRANDAGIPQLSMHGIRATTGSLDPGLGVKPYKGFFDYYEDFDAEFRQFSTYIKLLVSFGCIVGSVESPGPPPTFFLLHTSSTKIIGQALVGPSVKHGTSCSTLYELTVSQYY